MLGALSFEGPLVFCGSETRGISGVEESRKEIRSADSTLRKEAYSRNFSQHCGSTTWRLILWFNEEGLEFKVVFISYASTCGFTVWKTDSTQGILSQEAITFRTAREGMP